MSGQKSDVGVGPGKVDVKCLIVYDKYGRVCLDRDVFFNDEQLRLIQEAVKNGSDSRNGDS